MMTVCCTVRCVPVCVGPVGSYNTSAGIVQVYMLQLSCCELLPAGPKQQSALGMWGYLVHIKALDQLLLFVDCPTVKALPAIQKHPVFHYMHQQSQRYTFAWSS